MKKFKYVLFSLLTILAFTAIDISNSTKANAQSHHKVKYVLTIPKNMRGTWYSKSDFFGNYSSKLIITKHSIKETTTTDENTFKEKTTIHKPLTKKQIKNALDANDGTRYAKYFLGKNIKSLKYKWLKAMTLDFDGDSQPSYFNVHKFNKNNVLTYATGPSPENPHHYLKTYKLAKKYAHKKYPHFNYREAQL